MKAEEFLEKRLKAAAFTGSNPKAIDIMEQYANQRVIEELERVEETFPKTFNKNQAFEQVWMKLADLIIKLKQ